ncbi:MULTISPECIES: hypothetical protein [Cyanophyceae]|uniref:hypothetical protein n=1 Tax=Cyanophyceae TaxID=3028117 RepID=UPI001689470F|nr:hypothetical protein [Trichocoleus sp. FACHB-40]MBD2005619.1 hypothetical protein [Trichocoleus sp. FACHB-40]
MTTKIYARAIGIATSQTDDVPVAKFKILHFAVARGTAVTQGDLSLWGRNRHLKLETAISKGTGKAKALLKHFTKVVGEAVSETTCKYLDVSPPIPTPVGELFLNSKRLQEQRLPKSRRHSFSFSISGKRLARIQDGCPVLEGGLEFSFSLRTLSGQTLLTKTNHSGIYLDELVTHSDNSQTLTGFVNLLPHETVFPDTSTEVELNYIFSLGNGSTRDYLIESEYFTFYSA